MRHVILDRDGVLNHENPRGGYVKRPREWHWLPGARAALTALAGLGVRVSVATNQSGVGRGLMTLDDLEAVHARMRREAAEVGGRFDAIYFCPHAPDEGCDCRKPKPGMLLQAIAESGVPAEETVFIADARRDLEAAEAAGVKAWLVRTGKGARTAGELQAEGRLELADAIYDTLSVAVATLITRAHMPVIPSGEG